MYMGKCSQRMEMKPVVKQAQQSEAPEGGAVSKYPPHQALNGHGGTSSFHTWEEWRCRPTSSFSQRRSPFYGLLRGPHLGKVFCFSGKETHWLSEDSVLGLRLYGFTVPAPVLSPPSTCGVLDLSRRLCKMGSLVVLPHRIGVRLNSVNTHEKLRRAHGKHSVSMGDLHYSPSALTGSVTFVS